MEENMEGKQKRKETRWFGPALDKIDRLSTIPDDVLAQIARSVPEREVGRFALASRDLARAARGRPITEGCKNPINTLAEFSSHKSAARDKLSLRQCLADAQTRKLVRQRQLSDVYQWMRGLRVLDLSQNGLSAAEFSLIAMGLERTTTLTSLDLSSNRRPERAHPERNPENPFGVQELARALAVNTVLKKLDLSYNTLMDVGAIALGNALKTNKTLKELGLINCNIRAEGAKALVSALSEGGAVLTQLDLRFNDIGGYYDESDALIMSDPSDTQALASALVGTAVLTECSLLKNNHDAESAHILAKIGTEKRIMLSGMKRDQTEVDFSSHHLQTADAILISSDLRFMVALTSLNLEGNDIGADGAEALADALKSGMAVLTHLNLSFNRIGVEGAKALADALKSGMGALTILSLAENDLADNGRDMSGIEALASALAGNAVLTGLDVLWNNLGDGAKRVLRDAVARRKDDFRILL